MTASTAVLLTQRIAFQKGSSPRQDLLVGQRFWEDLRENILFSGLSRPMGILPLTWSTIRCTVRKPIKGSARQ